jgi:hypothetical protein
MDNNIILIGVALLLLYIYFSHEKEKLSNVSPIKYSSNNNVLHYRGDPVRIGNILKNTTGTLGSCQKECNSMLKCTHFDRTGNNCTLYKGDIWLGSAGKGDAVYCKGPGPCENGYTYVPYSSANNVLHYRGDTNRETNIIKTIDGASRDKCQKECTNDKSCTHFDMSNTWAGNNCTLYKGGIWLGSAPGNQVYCKGPGPCSNGYTYDV